jgi:Domain of unknown function (DUF6456)
MRSHFAAALADSLSAAPTPERGNHDRITREVETLADSDGGIGLPWRVETMLERMERRGAISAAQRHAGEEFHRLFRLAALDPLRAADMLRGDRASRADGNGIERARRRVDDALLALGGQGSPCGSCAWFVLGCELSLAGWARREGWQGRPLREEVAKGILTGALGVLTRHFGM